MIKFALYDIFLFRGGMQYRLKPLWRLIQSLRVFDHLSEAGPRWSAAALKGGFRLEVVSREWTMKRLMGLDWRKVSGC